MGYQERYITPIFEEHYTVDKIEYDKIYLIQTLVKNLPYIPWTTDWFVGIKSKVGDSGVTHKSSVSGDWDKGKGQSEGINGRGPENNSSYHTYR